ncbi:hypothetical protein GALMADRAFT_1127483 [Galerina marginata CBS 339.88]|uniref:Uncharacterized protein n=1 Tax=Galerina marginata (strain CBS 339.88) TaxID=685588 RepID=A0A067SBF8_GALM3|nr:hypothetical protein GALMADRAFT_1127483 [Galerina marginata CBS 339.88]
MLAEAILQLRLYALYSGKKKILCLMLTVYVVCSAASAWIMENRLATISKTLSTQIPNGRFCTTNYLPPRLYTFWIPILACETLLFVLAVARGFQSLTNDDHGPLPHRGQQLFDLLIRDSVIYFLVIGLVYLGCLIFWIMNPSILWEAPIGFSVAFSCTLSSRMILNIREAGDLQARSCSQQLLLPTSPPTSSSLRE